MSDEGSKESKKGIFSFWTNRKTMRKSKRGLKSEDNSEDKERLRRLRQKKRKKFGWLTRFLSRRPSKKELEKSGILQENDSPIGGVGAGGSGNTFFGVPLKDVYADSNRIINNVPKPVYYCGQHIESLLTLEGIFRVSGTFSEMNRLTETFEKGETPDLTAVDNKHSISGLLEKYFRELPQPVTTWALYDEFMVAASPDFSEQQQKEYLKKTVEKLPKENQLLLRFFLGLMRKISRVSEVNKMGEKNLGVVFGSIILGPENLLLSLGDKQKLQNQSVVVGMLITHCFFIFPDLIDELTEEDKIKDGLVKPAPLPLPISEGNSTENDSTAPSSAHSHVGGNESYDGRNEQQAPQQSTSFGDEDIDFPPPPPTNQPTTSAPPPLYAPPPI